WTGFFVYGPPVRAERNEFWNSFALEVAAVSEPWAVMGDLNLILEQIEKFGGTTFEQFQHLVRERLDRVVGDPNWVVSFPKAGVRALAVKDSDHAPLMLDLLFNRDRFKTPFRYLDAWSRDPSCKELVKEAWRIEIQGVKSFQLMSRIAHTRKCLSKWNKLHFGYCSDKLNMLNRLLVEVQGLDVWNSPWVPWINWQQSRATFNPLIQQKSVYASSLIRDDGEWNLDLVRRWFVPTLASSINLITRLPGGYVDRLIWKDSTAGLFSTKEAYKAIIRRRLGVKDKTWSDLWKSPQQERVKLFL
ncbi:hypothetical protein G4B88_002009, partial [Cannabis sativa]